MCLGVGVPYVCVCLCARVCNAKWIDCYNQVQTAITQSIYYISSAIPASWRTIYSFHFIHTIVHTISSVGIASLLPFAVSGRIFIIKWDLVYSYMRHIEWMRRQRQKREQNKIKKKKKKGNGNKEAQKLGSAIAVNPKLQRIASKYRCALRQSMSVWVCVCVCVCVCMRAHTIPCNVYSQWIGTDTSSNTFNILFYKSSRFSFTSLTPARQIQYENVIENVLGCEHWRVVASIEAPCIPLIRRRRRWWCRRRSEWIYNNTVVLYAHGISFQIVYANWCEVPRISANIHIGNCDLFFSPIACTNHKAIWIMNVKNAIHCWVIPSTVMRNKIVFQSGQNMAEC